jgi:hypothetical protein
MSVCRNYIYILEPRFTNLIRSWRPFVTRNVRKPKLCVLSDSYTATDALPPILPACRQPLLPSLETPFVTRDLFCSENLFVNRMTNCESKHVAVRNLYIIYTYIVEIDLHCISFIFDKEIIKGFKSA